MKSLQNLIEQLNKKQISSVELTQFYLERIKQHNPQYNAFITVTEATALKQAENADQMRRQSDQHHPLLGIPIAYKDIFCTKNIRTTCGSKMLSNFISPYDAYAVKRLTHIAGMPMLGKVNMDEFAMGSSNEHSYFGVCKNPWNDAYVCGGSSGGSACAVAADLSPVSIGTDTGGSIRQPAAFCGLTAIKPTYGSISRFGMIAFASSLDQAGPIVKNAWDAGIILNALISHDPNDSTSMKRKSEDFLAKVDTSLTNLTIGLPKKLYDFIDDPAIQKTFFEFIKFFESKGVKLVDIDLPHSQHALPAYYVIAPAECSSNLARFDGVRYGYRCENPKDLDDLYCRSRSEGFGNEVKRRILLGTQLLSSESYDDYYLKAQKIRRLIAQDFNQAFEKVDFIAMPTTPTPAFKIGENTQNVLDMYNSDIFTVLASLTGLPAICAPCGQKNGLPISAQLIGPHFSEASLIGVMHQYQQLTDWHQRHPKL